MAMRNKENLWARRREARHEEMWDVRYKKRFSLSNV